MRWWLEWQKHESVEEGTMGTLVGGGRKRGKVGEEQEMTQQDKGKKKRLTQKRWWEGVPWMTSVEMTKLIQKWGGGGKVIIANTERIHGGGSNGRKARRRLANGCSSNKHRGTLALGEVQHDREEDGNT